MKRTAHYGTMVSGRWRRCTRLVPLCMGRAARDSCTCTEPPPGSVQELLEETERRVRREERTAIVRQIRALHADLQNGNAVPMGYEWLARVIETGMGAGGGSAPAGCSGGSCSGKERDE